MFKNHIHLIGIENALRGHLADVHYSISKTAGESKILDAYYFKIPNF